MVINGVMEFLWGYCIQVVLSDSDLTYAISRVQGFSFCEIEDDHLLLQFSYIIEVITF